MKRIAGILNLDCQPVASDEIRRMLDALALDDCSQQECWVKGKVGLGCVQVGNARGTPGERTLAGLTGQGYALVFDGRLDNRAELSAALKTQQAGSGCPASAEELVLAAYQRWGLECPARLVGDFAFALWDGVRQRLVCARDHFGVKPLYYALHKNSFLFASTPCALLASRKVPVAIREERIADFLVNPLEAVDKTSSFYQDVFRLPPAHVLVVQAGGMTLERYWELRPLSQPAGKTEAEYVEAFQEIFKEAVCCRLRDQSVPAAMLSGGMDSSAIVGIGRKLLAEGGASRLHAFAVVSNSPDQNRESAHISSVLEQGNLKPYLIAETEILQRMEALVRAIETETEPFDCLMNLNRVAYLHAREQGVSALLDGVDGDVLLSGSGHLTQLWRAGALRTILGETFQADGLTAEYKLGRKLFFTSLLSSFLTTLAPMEPAWMRRLRRGHGTRAAVESAVKDSIIAREFAVSSRLGERFARLDFHSPRPPSLKQVEFHKIALEHTFLTVGLERYERVASAFGIEARHPFTDVRLAEFCLGLPWHLKTRHGWTKLILRRALEADLPPEVIWRRDKDSLMWEVNRLILKERAAYFYQLTCDEGNNLKPYIDMPKLMGLWQAYLSDGDERGAESLWSGVALALWLRQQRQVQGTLR